MSSLRLALKQSLQESGGMAPKKTKERKSRPPGMHTPNLSGTANHTTTNNGVPLRRKRRPGDPPRKRGRPRKHPLPEQLQPKDEKQQGIQHHNHHNNDDADQSSDENEFSDSESFENMENEIEHHSNIKDTDKDDDNETGTQRDYDGDHSLTIMDHDELAARKKQKNLLKKMKQENLAANTIQRKLSEWTKKKVAIPRATSPKPPKKKPTTEQSERSNPDLEAKRSVKGIVPAPAPEIIDWVSSMSVKKQRRNMFPGLRVKVRFATKVKKRDGKIVNKHKWYGGLITAMSSGGSKIRIKYDDSTMEIAKFPDDDIIVDDEGNDRHQAPADAFQPPINSDDEDASREIIDTENSPDPTGEKKTPESTPRPDDGEVSDDWQSERKDIGSSRFEISTKKPQRMREVELTDDAATHDETISVEGHVAERSGNQGNNPNVPYEISGGSEESKPLRVPPIEENSSKDDLDHDNEGIDRKDAHIATHKGEVATGMHSTEVQGLQICDHVDNSDESSDDDGTMEVIAEGRGFDVVARTASEEISDDERFGEKGIADKENGEAVDNELAHTTRGAYEADVEARDEEHAIHVEHPVRAIKDDLPVVPEMDGSSKGLDTVHHVHNDDDDVRTNDAFLIEQAQAVDNEESPPRFNDKPLMENPRPHKRKREAPENDEVNSRAATPIEASVLKPKRVSPFIVLSEFKKDPSPSGNVAKPVSKVARSVNVGPHGDVPTKQDSPQIVSSHNSAFDKKEKLLTENIDIHAKESEHSVDDDGYALTPHQDPGDLSLAQRSGRRAAQQANERIASRQELIIAEAFVKPKKKKMFVEKPDTKPLNKKRKDSENGVDGTDGENQWVQCDLCAKWRVLPSTVDVDKLPNRWYCEMNVYDALHNSCDAAEQTPEEIAKAKRKAKRRLARRARLEAEAAATAAAVLSEDIKVEPREREKEKEVKIKVAKCPPPEKRKREEKVVEEVRKRSSPISNLSEDEAKQSSGSNSDSDQPKESKKARRARSKEDEGLAEVSDGLKGKGRGRIRRVKDGKEGKDEKPKGRKGSNKGKEDNQEWVLCEKCEKWRRLPPHVSADDLPDVWYCTMNTWDPTTSTCGAAEDKADPSSHIVAGFGAHGGHKLSYRSLIFGTGKKQHRPISERMRAAESLFSTQSFTDLDTTGTHPTVMYANSTMFINRSNAARAAEERNKERMTFLELMGHSNLWTELRGLDRQFRDQGDSEDVRQEKQVGVGIRFSWLSDDERRSLKEMIYCALGTSTLASHDILLEAQCGSSQVVPDTWTKLRSICTVEMIVACLLEMVKDGRIEEISSTNSVGTAHDATPMYRRVMTFANTNAYEDHHHATRCMKIAKPWKHGFDITGKLLE